MSDNLTDWEKTTVRDCVESNSPYLFAIRKMADTISQLRADLATEKLKVDEGRKLVDVLVKAEAERDAALEEIKRLRNLFAATR